MAGKRKTISTDSKLENQIGFSRACRVGNLISVSGTAPIIDGETVCVDDVYGQTKACFEISLNAIEQAGGSIQGVIRTRIMLTDISRWEDAAKAHSELFSRTKPACTFVEVSGFIDPLWLIETEVDCVLPDN